MSEWTDLYDVAVAVNGWMQHSSAGDLCRGAENQQLTLLGERNREVLV